MQSNEYNNAYDDYSDYQQQNALIGQDEVDAAGMLIMEGSSGQQGEGGSSPGQLLGGSQDGFGGAENSASSIDFNDPKIASLPRILLMGPRRGGKTSIQVCSYRTDRSALGMLSCTSMFRPTMFISLLLLQPRSLAETTY